MKDCKQLKGVYLLLETIQLEFQFSQNEKKNRNAERFLDFGFFSSLSFSHEKAGEKKT